MDRIEKTYNIENLISELVSYVQVFEADFGDHWLDSTTRSVTIDIRRVCDRIDEIANE